MSTPSIEWTKVLIHPLGLVGYVLFLVFGLVARAKRRDEKRWLQPAALTAAGIVLVGTLGLAYLQVERKNHEAATCYLQSRLSRSSKMITFSRVAAEPIVQTCKVCKARLHSLTVPERKLQNTENHTIGLQKLLIIVRMAFAYPVERLLLLKSTMASNQSLSKSSAHK